MMLGPNRRFLVRLVGFVLSGVLVLAQQEPAAPRANDGPTSDKAKKTFQEADQFERKNDLSVALDGFRKADKQDGGHCVACKYRALHCAMQLADWKAAQEAASSLASLAQGPRDQALAYYQLGTVFFFEGTQKHKDEFFSQAHGAFAKAVALAPNFPDAVFGDGRSLAYLHQDDAAKQRFEQLVKMPAANPVDKLRAQRYLEHPELARARMAPGFEVTTVDGKHLSLDELKGTVVLIDFWATWCGPCRAALPHMRDIAKKFQGEPLVILSVSLDKDEQKWKDFITQNEMTWPQCRSAEGFDGELPHVFAVEAIPHTFTIDADGVLQDEHIGDASIEGKLKKLVAHAHELQAASASR
jgi:thiol-disulfide isomerase/thioredoxin